MEDGDSCIIRLFVVFVVCFFQIIVKHIIKIVFLLILLFSIFNSMIIVIVQADFLIKTTKQSQNIA